MKKLLAFALAAAALVGCEKKPELHIYTWSDYIAPEVIATFEKDHNCTIVVDTFDSNEAMYAKLKAGGTGYDIIMPSSYQVVTMAKEGMIKPLDHTKCPTVKKNFDPAFNNQIIDPNLTYSVPYSVTYTGFMYLKDKMPAGAAVDSWSILDNPALKGKITLLDDMREVIGGALMSQGYSMNTRSQAEMDKAVAKAIQWRANIRKFDAESYKTEVAGGATYLGHGYSTDATQVIVGDEEEGMAPRPDIGFVLPKEGFSIAFDEMAIAADAPQPDLAYAFIDYIYMPETAKINMEYICGPVPSKPGIDLLDADYRDLIILKPEVIRRGQVIRAVDDDPKVMEMYNAAWDKIKATEAK